MIQQLLRSHATPLRFGPGPSQQRPESGKRHAFGTECQCGATAAVGVRHRSHRPGGGPIARIRIVRHGRAEMLGVQQILPERGEAALAIRAILREQPFQVIAHRPDDFSFGPGAEQQRGSPVERTAEAVFRGSYCSAALIRPLNA